MNKLYILFLLFFCSCTKNLDSLSHINNLQTTEAVSKNSPSLLPNIAVQLLLGNGSSSADGVKEFFSPSFSYIIGDEDSYKWCNPDENLSIYPPGADTTALEYYPTKMLSMEGRPFPVSGKTDTIQLRIWNYQQNSYILQIDPKNIPGNISISLCDRYMGSKTLISSLYQKPFTTISTDSLTQNRKSNPFRFKLLIKNN